MQGHFKWLTVYLSLITAWTFYHIVVGMDKFKIDGYEKIKGKWCCKYYMNLNCYSLILRHMKYKADDRYCVKIVIECAECAGIGPMFHQPIDTHDANLCIWVVLHIILPDAVTLIKNFPALHVCNI